jgi:hypothetical protein
VTTAEDPPADDFVVQVAVRRAADPAAQVAAVLRQVAPEATAEVFPACAPARVPVS